MDLKKNNNGGDQNRERRSPSISPFSSGCDLCHRALCGSPVTGRARGWLDWPAACRALTVPPAPRESPKPRSPSSASILCHRAGRVDSNGLQVRELGVRAVMLLGRVLLVSEPGRKFRCPEISLHFPSIIPFMPRWEKYVLVLKVYGSSS